MVSCMNYSIRDFYYQKKNSNSEACAYLICKFTYHSHSNCDQNFLSCALYFIHKYLNKDSFEVSITMCHRVFCATCIVQPFHDTIIFSHFFSRKSDGKRQTSAEGMHVAIGVCITAIFAIWNSNAVYLVN